MTTRNNNKADKYNINGQPTGWWWLRSPGAQQNEATGVGYEGYVGTSGDASLTGGMIRPVICIKI